MCVTSLPAARVGRCWQAASSPNSHRDFDTSLRGVGSLSPALGPGCLCPWSGWPRVWVCGALSPEQPPRREEPCGRCSHDSPAAVRDQQACG